MASIARPPRLPAPFRDQTIAATLKLGKPVADGVIPGAFRDQTIAATLKLLRAVASRHYIHSFRDQTIAATLKHGKKLAEFVQRNALPRSNDRGHIEAM